MSCSYLFGMVGRSTRIFRGWNHPPVHCLGWRVALAQKTEEGSRVHPGRHPPWHLPKGTPKDTPNVFLLNPQSLRKKENNLHPHQVFLVLPLLAPHDPWFNLWWTKWTTIFEENEFSSTWFIGVFFFWSFLNLGRFGVQDPWIILSRLNWGHDKIQRDLGSLHAQAWHQANGSRIIFDNHQEPHIQVRLWLIFANYTSWRFKMVNNGQQSGVTELATRENNRDGPCLLTKIWGPRIETHRWLLRLVWWCTMSFL